MKKIVLGVSASVLLSLSSFPLSVWAETRAGGASVERLFDPGVGVVESVALAARTLVVSGKEYYLPSSASIVVYDVDGREVEGAALRHIQQGIRVKIAPTGTRKLNSVIEYRASGMDK